MTRDGSNLDGVKNIDLLNVEQMIPAFCFMSVIFNMKDDVDEKFDSGALCTTGTRYGKGAKSCEVERWKGSEFANSGQVPALLAKQYCH